MRICLRCGPEGARGLCGTSLTNVISFGEVPSQSSCTTSHSQQKRRVLVSGSLCPLSGGMFIFASLLRVKCSLIMLLIRISLIARWNTALCVLALWVFSSMTCLFTSFAWFLFVFFFSIQVYLLIDLRLFMCSVY